MDEFERVAAAAVREAGPHLCAAWGEAKRIEYKGAIDLVTETDRQVEEMLVSQLTNAFPSHRMIAEEGSSGGEIRPPSDSEYVWYLDPIDGTTNFAHSYPQFAISVALAKGADTLLGIVHDPIRGETFQAKRDGGATLNGAPIGVSEVSDLERALVATGFPYDCREHARFYLDFFEAFMLRAQGVRRFGSAALDLCYLACGRLDGFWEWKLKPWDTAAGALIIGEAGGVLSNFGGEPFDVHGEQTLASNGRIHTQMLEVLRRCLTPT